MFKSIQIPTRTDTKYNIIYEKINIFKSEKRNFRFDHFNRLKYQNFKVILI